MLSLYVFNILNLTFISYSLPPPNHNVAGKSVLLSRQFDEVNFLYLFRKQTAFCFSLYMSYMYIILNVTITIKGKYLTCRYNGMGGPISGRMYTHLSLVNQLS